MDVKIVLKESTREFDKIYTYTVPAELESQIQTGAHVIVPFGKGNTHKEAYVLGFTGEEKPDFYTKPILSVSTPCPVLRADQIDLAHKMRLKYTCTYGDTFRLMVPPLNTAKEKTARTAYLCDPEEAASMLDNGEFSNLNQVRVVELLLDCEEAPVSDIISACQITESTLRTLAKKNVISFGKIKLDPVNGEAKQEQEEEESLQQAFQCTSEQANAVERILGSDPDLFHEYLLYGITGSGKTEVYMQVTRDLIDRDYGAILLVPEISLTPLMITRMKARFGDRVSVLHSRLTPKERLEQWKAILEDRVRIVVGARSAVFAPVKNLKMIIIDEEQETTYKSETHPKYHAADIARIRMQTAKGILVLGSATPNVETYYRAQTGQSILLQLSERIGNAGLPLATIVDMREELAAGNRSIFSRLLMQNIQEAFSRKEQVILFLNRRGHSGFYLCRDCGYVPKCDSCSVSLTYHSSGNGLICHYCGHIRPVPKKCPQCGSLRIGGFGAGTQKIEEICVQEFPGHQILRMDQDTTTGRGSHAKILEKFGQKDADLLVGTQMIAKGHDFPDVTVVGILSADLMLGMSDFRSSERAFQLITQAAGRAGRGDKPGKVIIQAYNTDDYAVVHAANQDYPGFYKEEITFRKAMGYPPFGAIGILLVSSVHERAAYEEARKIRYTLQELVHEQKMREGQQDPARTATMPGYVEVMDVSKAPVYKIRNCYRIRIVLKGQKEEDLAFYFNQVQKMEQNADVRVSFDLNPFHMM